MLQRNHRRPAYWRAGLTGTGLIGSGLIGSGLIGSGLIGSGLIGSALIGILSISSTSASFATEFLRGDANGDGVVGLPDAHMLTHILFLASEPDVRCGDAADFNDDGQINISDTIGALNFVVGGHGTPAAPYPEPGPDPTGDVTDSHFVHDEIWPCEDSPLAPSLDDPSAEMRILDVVATGGDDRQARIVIAFSSSTTVAGYTGVIDTGGVFEDRELSDADWNDGVVDLSGANFFQGFLGVRTDGPLLHFGYLTSITSPVSIPAGDLRPVLQIELCLREGVEAADYPLDLVSGELVDYGSARRIEPTLHGGSLTVSQATHAEECVIRSTEPVTEPDYDVEFRLGAVDAPPGTQAVMPFIIRSTGPGHGYFATLDFDEDLLRIDDVVPVFERADGEEFFFLKRRNNLDENPGGVGVDEGWVRWIAHVARPYEQVDVIPPNEDVVMAELHFTVSETAEEQVSEIRFVPSECDPDPHDLCYAHSNVISAHGWVLDPVLVNSYVYVNGRLNIIGKVSTFIRGDANSDSAVDLSDAQATLNFLFLGTQDLGCLDAADANDDGLLNVSDPIATLSHLFLGAGSLPPPTVRSGLDPTDDDLNCFFGT